MKKFPISNLAIVFLVVLIIGLSQLFKQTKRVTVVSNSVSISPTIYPTTEVLQNHLDKSQGYTNEGGKYIVQIPAKYLLEAQAGVSGLSSYKMRIYPDNKRKALGEKLGIITVEVMNNPLSQKTTLDEYITNADQAFGPDDELLAKKYIERNKKVYRFTFSADGGIEDSESLSPQSWANYADYENIIETFKTL